MLLILGTVPSLRSLELRQSYGHRFNLFWTVRVELFDAGPEQAYAERISRLQRRGVGNWLVLQQCERPGSLDSSIVRESEVANDIPGLLRTHAGIRAIALNGGRAQQSFRRHVQARMDPVLRERVTLLDLPSTSPANASMSRAAKFARWQELLPWVDRAG
jgi:TDG/mug DNA glycosylase family protein